MTHESEKRRAVARMLERIGQESEKAIEAYLVSEVRRRGGLCLKYSNPAEAGYPDRLVILPREGCIGPAVCFIELKRKGEKPRPLQVSRMNALRALGANAFVCDCKADVDAFMRAYDESKEASL
jgi:hypothetical protein